MAILLYPTVLRVHADLVSRGAVRRCFDAPRIRNALMLAWEAVGLVRRMREEADGLLSVHDPRADEAAAVLVAFAAESRAFGSGVDAVAVIDALVRTQLELGGWRLYLSAAQTASLIVGTMLAIDGGLPVGFDWIASTLAAALRPPRMVRENSMRYAASMTRLTVTG